MSFFKAGLLFSIPTIAKLLAGLVIVKAIAVYLGVDGLGRLGQFMSLMAMLGVLAGGGIATGVIKYVAEFHDQKNKLEDFVQTANCITLIAGVLFAFILFFLAPLLSQFLFKTPEYTFEIRILSLVQIAIGLSSFLLGILNGLRQMKAYALVSLCSVLLGAMGLVFACAWYGMKGAMYGMMWFSSCPLIFLIIWYRFLFKGTWSFIKPRWLPKIAQQFSHFSVMQLVTVFTMQMSQIVIRNAIETQTSWVEVGYWQGLVKISDAYLLFITVVLANYYMPKLSALKEKRAVIQEVIATYKIIVPTLLLCMPILFIFRNTFILILYSDQFLAMGDLFFWQITGDFLKVMAYISGYVAVAKAASKIYITAEIFQACTLVLLSLFLIDLYGLQGAVYAYVITYFIYSILSIYCLRVYAKRH